MAENMRRRRGLHLLILISATTALIAGCTAPGDTNQGDDGASSASASAEPEGEAAETISYVCGLQNAEDLVRVGTTPWLLASSLVAGGTPGAGKIYLIDSDEKSVEEFFPGEAPALSNDATMFQNCPSIDLENFEVHWLSIRETEPGMYRLYATKHGAVEDIQAWEIDATRDKTQPTWVGCVP